VKKGKVGIAESDKDTIMEALLAVDLSPTKPVNSKITIQGLYDLGLIGQQNSSELREKIGESLHIGHTNGKTLLKRVNMMGVSYEALKKAVEE
jgi:ribonuclease M5